MPICPSAISSIKVPHISHCEGGFIVYQHRCKTGVIKAALVRFLETMVYSDREFQHFSMRFHVLGSDSSETLLFQVLYEFDYVFS